MPLTAKGEEIKGALEKEYGGKAGERILYAGKNKGTFTGIDAQTTTVKGLEFSIQTAKKSKANAKGPKEERYYQERIEKYEEELKTLKSRGDVATSTGIDADSSSKIDDALLGLRMAIKSLTSATVNEVKNETRLLKSALNECLALDISRTNNRFSKRAELIMQANALMARRSLSDSSTMTRIADAINNLQQRFDAMVDAEPGEYTKKFRVSYHPVHGEAPTQGGPDKHIEVSAKSTEHAVKLANAQTGANWQRFGVKEIK